MSFRFVCVAAAGALLAAASPASAAFTLSFSGLVGSSNPLSVPTADGNTVTFDSPSGPATFSVGSTTGLFNGFSTGLGDYASFVGDTLTITFAKPLGGSLTMPFGIEDAFGTFGGDFLTITPNVGAAIVASGVLDSLTLSEPEGTAYINAPGATELTITSANPFAIGGVSVPEPITLSILGMGLAGLGAARRRRA
jgi:hypothetical protein